MKLNSKVTGGLAWAGLVLILAVPSAEMLSKPSAWRADTGTDSTAPAVAVEAMETAVVAPKPATRPVAPGAPAAGDDPVEAYIASGKKLPSYISDAPDAGAREETAAAAPAAPATTRKIVVPTVPQTAAAGSDGTFIGETDEITTASVDPAEMPPPMPYPVSMRPAAPSVATAGEAPLVIDEDALTRREVASQSAEPFLQEPAHIVDGEQLEEWDSGSLADYLERRGLLGDAEPAARDRESEFDEDGFFLSDGPNNGRRDDGPRLIGRYEGGWLLF